MKKQFPSSFQLEKKIDSNTRVEKVNFIDIDNSFSQIEMKNVFEKRTIHHQKK